MQKKIPKKKDDEIELVDRGKKDEYESPFFDLPRIHTKHILLHCRQIMIDEEIDENVANDIRTKLLALDKINQKAIYVWINSPGGSVLSGLAVIDTFRNVGSPIITIVNGFAASMAAMISIMGDYRLMTKHSYWMQHPMSSWNADYLSFMRDSMDWLNRLDKQTSNILKNNTNLTIEQLKKIKIGELWLSSSDCKKYGIVDKILNGRKPYKFTDGPRSCDIKPKNKKK